MLRLTKPTRPGWFSEIEPSLDVILVDHAHLEKRAASTALSMVFRYTSRARLIRELSGVVREEMEHFEQMLDLLQMRGVELIRLDPSPYASRLVKLIRGHEPEQLLDKLLVAALIEARSCERFRILAENVSDIELAGFYHELFESEARHYTLYTGLAREYFGEDEVEDRLDELSRLESQILSEATGPPRLHSY